MRVNHRLYTVPPETRIFLVRHGETEWNKQNRLQGNRDSLLTPSGREQAFKLKKSFEMFSIDRAYVSPLKRARDTLGIVLEDRDVEVSVRANLREINLGPWEGKTHQEAALSHPDEYRAFRERPDLFNLPAAETFQALQNRMVEELESIFADNVNKNILVVSHWIAIKASIAYYSSIPLSQLSTITDPANGEALCLLKREKGVLVQQ